ncbi:MAG TPA: hypothetical protein PLP22_10655 [Candidatus Competibacter sp.]|nr:hypothetical protein [Candidatus Competibacter sp.]HUM94821.1 hypothetical protein [Candidatus Competibacter sp.]
MSQTTLHPALQKLAVTHRRRLRSLGLLLFLAVAGLLMFLMVAAFTSRDAGNLLLLGLVGFLMLPVVASLGGIMWFLDRWLSRGLNEADQLLRDCAPQSARLTPLGRGDGMGLLAALRLATAQPASAPAHALINPAFRWSSPPSGEIEVRLHCRALAPDSPWVALGPDGAPLIGKIVDREARQRRRRWLAVALAVVSLIVAVLASALLG